MTGKERRSLQEAKWENAECLISELRASGWSVDCLDRKTGHYRIAGEFDFYPTTEKWKHMRDARASDYRIRTLVEALFAAGQLPDHRG